ncbi:energy transducer TonB [Amphritea pacifica]|uniref:Protein TonB n=1 Tax=Amphritea pacifica TaxID=2811233 RepID=A0ABS2WBW8_9GAMM|nr:energy transducer TonB [Amphritea pacifica]MBN1008561.1 energy transducer TonB [Amphritea pacifica]
MNSLLATLIELRVFIITLLVSGAVHLTLIGSGWLSSPQPVRLGGQELNVRVTAPRSDNGSEESSREVNESHEHSAPHESSAPVIATATDQPAVMSAAKPPVRPAAQPVATSPERVPDHVPPAAEPDSKADSAETQLPKAEAPAVVREPPEKPPVTRHQAELLSSQSTPVYQNHPEFRVSPEPPPYPRLARKRGIEGQVVLRAEIGRDGAVEGVKVEHSSGSDLLDQAARDAVQQWQFVPARQNGLAVASYVRVPVDFVLEKR